MTNRQRCEPPHKMRRLGGWASLGFLLLVVGGCGESAQNEAVSGAVTWKGQPLERGTIEFVPADGPGVPIGGTVVNGRYQMNSTPGVPPGAYQVRISSRKGSRSPSRFPEADMIGPSVKEQLPPQYNVKTQLQAEVRKSGENTFDFDLN